MALTDTSLRPDGPAATLGQSRWLQLLSLGLVLGIWQLAASLGHALSPLTVGERLLAYARDGSLFLQTGITLLRVAGAFTVAMLAGSALGVLLGNHATLDRLAGPWLVVALNMPALVVIILCYIWLGLTETAALVAVAFNKIPTIAVILREGARAVDRDLVEVAAAFRVPAWRAFRRVYLPQLLPYLVAAARAGLAMTWKIVLVVELLGRPNGIGFKLGTLFQFFDVAGLLAYSFFFIAIVLLIEAAFLAPIERRLARWRG